jgi:hypothetical protein
LPAKRPSKCTWGYSHDRFIVWNNARDRKSAIQHFSKDIKGANNDIRTCPDQDKPEDGL